jgi:PTS system nitrogen regulatory IIA component
MDLKIKDVADLFNVSESTIHRWISDGKIPSYRINRLHAEHRFSIPEMENWVMSHKLANTNGVSPFTTSQKPTETERGFQTKTTGGIKQFSLFRAIHKGEVITNLAGNSKEEIMRATMKRASKNLNLDPELVTELLLGREKLMPTALNNGIGAPHSRDTRLCTHHDIVLIVFPETPLDYGALDGKPVHTLFFLFASNDRHHLHLLAKIAHLSSQPQSLELFRSKPSKDELLAYVKQWESGIAQAQD